MILPQIAEGISNDLNINVYIDNAPSAYETPIVILKCINDFNINGLHKKEVTFILVDDIGKIDNWLEDFKTSMNNNIENLTLGIPIIIKEEYGRDEQNQKEMFTINCYIFIKEDD